MIAVTGSTGLLGSQIVRTLVESGHKVVAIKRETSNPHLLKDIYSSVVWRDADILDSIELEEALQDVSIVIHAAAMVSLHPRDKKRLMQVNVEGTANVVNCCLSQKISKLIHISSVAAVGRPRKMISVDENQKWVDGPYNSTYAESKYLAELEVMRGQEEGLNTVLLNPSAILAPADTTRSTGKLFEYVLEQRRFYVDGFINYVSVRDVATIVERFISLDAPGQRFIVNGGSTSYKELFESIAKHLHKRAPSIRVPQPLIGLLAKASTVFSMLTGADPLITTEVARITAQSIVYNNQKISKLLQYEFEPLDHTLEWCAKYYLNAYKV